MASAPIDVPIKVKGLNDLQKLERRMEALEKEVERLTKDLNKNAEASKKAGKAAATASGNIQRFGVAFRTTLGPLVALTGALTLFGRSLRIAGDRAADVNVLANGLGKLGGTQQDLKGLVGIADELGKATLFDQEDFVASAGLLTSFTNVAVKEYGRVLEVASDLAQTNKVGVKDSLLQLAKALNDPVKNLTALSRAGIQFSKGQTELIKGLVEAGDVAQAQNLILKELEKQYGGNARAAGKAGLAGAFDTLGEEYRDLAEVIGRALEPAAVSFLGVLTQLLSSARQIAERFGGVFKVIGDGFQAAITEGTLFNKLIRTLIASLAVLAAVKAFTAIVTGLKAAIAFTKQLVTLTKALTAANILAGITGLLKSKPGLIAAAVAGLGVGIDQLFNDGNLTSTVTDFFRNAIGAAFAGIESLLPSVDLALPTVSTGTAPTGTTPTGETVDPKDAEKLAKEAAKRAEAMRLGIASAERMLALVQAEEKALQGINEVQKAELQSQLAKEKIAIKYGALAEKTLSDAERALLVEAQALEIKNQDLRLKQQILDIEERALANPMEQNRLLQARLNGTEKQVQLELEIEKAVQGLPPYLAQMVEETLRQNAALEVQIEQADKLKAIYEQVGSAIKDGIVDSITAAIEGSKDLQAIWADILKDIGKLLIRQGIGMIGGQGGLGIPGFANGGIAPANQPAVVGEKGPEIIRPLAPTAVIPNDGFAEAAEAMISSPAGVTVDPFSETTEAVSTSAAVMQTRTAEESAAAMASGNGSMTIQTQVINSVEYATVDQVQAASAAAAKEARARVFGELKNKPARRAGIGL